jgi:Trk K+ transport system NAD-binding subunit
MLHPYHAISLFIMSKSEDEFRLERLRQQRRRYPLWRLVQANIRDVVVLMRRGGWFPLTSLLVVLAVGTTYLLFGYFPQLCAAQPGECPGFDPVRAFYETIQLIVFQSGLAFPADPFGRTIFFLVPLAGLFFLLQSLVDLARQLFNKSARPKEWQVSLARTYRDHILVGGLGRVGYRAVLQLLDAGYEVVVIEQNWESEFVPIILRLKVPIVAGDARDPEILRNAGLAQAKGILAAINDDLVNIEIALTARRRNPEVAAVLRIYNRQLDQRLETQFGRNSAFSSSLLAAPTLTAAAISRAIVHVLNTSEGLLGISEITVQEESRITGFVKSVEEQFGVRVLRVRDALGRERKAGFLHRLEAGYMVTMLGRLEDLERVRLQNLPGSKLGFLHPTPLQRPTERFNTVIVCGLGRIGTQMVRLLANSRPRPDIVVICGLNTPDRLVEEISELGVQVIRGDAREAATLREAGIERAYSVATMFSDDLLNLQIGLSARDLRPDVHLVLRVFSDVLAERLATLFGIHTAFSTSALAAPTLAAATVLRGVEYAFDLGAQLFTTRIFDVQSNDRFAGRSLSELRESEALLVILLRRNGETARLPNLGTVVQPGDQVTILADIRVLKTFV